MCRPLAEAVERSGGLGTDVAAAEVDVLGETGPAVSEVVGDLPSGQAGVVEPGRDRLAEHVRGDPREVGAVESCAQVAAGVARIAQSALRAGKDDQRVRVASRVDGDSAAEQVDDGGRKHEGAAARDGLGGVLDDQSQPTDTDDSGIDREGGRFEVDRGGLDGAGLAECGRRCRA